MNGCDRTLNEAISWAIDTARTAARDALLDLRIVSRRSQGRPAREVQCYRVAAECCVRRWKTLRSLGKGGL